MKRLPRMPRAFLLGAVLLAIVLTVLLGDSSPIFAQDSAADTAAAAASEGSGDTAAESTTTATVGDFGAIPLIWWIAPLAAIIGLVFSRIFFGQMMKADQGTDVMKGIAKDVQDGAMAYLWRQYSVLAIFFVVVAAILAGLAALGLQQYLAPVGFLTAGILSGVAGYLGMRTATHASSRTAAACRNAETGLNEGLRVAFRSGAVMGLTVVGLALLDICIWFIVLYSGALGEFSLQDMALLMLAFGMGASAQALFARVGGGIYTKAADVGADLVGKVEAGIPEDDPRNPATIADNVGDNVGDVAGMGADLYESYYGSVLAAAALGAAAALFLPAADFVTQLNFMLLPSAMAGIGILLSIAGIFLVKTKPEATLSELLHSMHQPIYIVGAGVVAVAFGLVATMLGTQYIGIAGSIVVGLVAGVWIGNRTEYYTSYDYEPTKGVSKQAEYGPATVIIDGIATGMWSTLWPVITIVLAIILAFGLAGGFADPALGLYGIGLAAVGMLSTLGFTLATDAYGPIADNAGGNAEMAGLDPGVRERTDALDSLGNTTAATGKGFAIGSAALTALALIASYVSVAEGQLEKDVDAIVAQAEAGEITNEERDEALAGMNIIYSGEPMLVTNGRASEALAAMKIEDPLEKEIALAEVRREVSVRPMHNASAADFMAYYNVNLMNPIVLVGLFLGAMLAFAFCAMTMKAVGRAAAAMVAEVRRQFREIPGIMSYKPGDTSEENMKGRPDYANCVSISTKGAQREMTAPALLAISIPIVVGLLLGVAGVIGLLAGALSAGFVLAIMMANAGGSWDNAKKWIESRGKLTLAQVFSDSEEDKAKVAKHEEMLDYTEDEQKFRNRYSNANPERVIDEEAGVKLKDLWEDDAKFRKYVQQDPDLFELRPDRVVDGKTSLVHDAGVTGDTVGDPFKDTSGPSLNILIKLMAMVSLVFAGLTATYGSQIADAWQDLLRGLGQ